MKIYNRRIGDYEEVPDEAALECLDNRGDGTCRGKVEWHSTDPGRQKAWPRCEAHWQARLEHRQNSMERYADSDVPPAWFDPTLAGERWDEE